MTSPTPQKLARELLDQELSLTSGDPAQVWPKYVAEHIALRAILKALTYPREELRRDVAQLIDTAKALIANEPGTIGGKWHERANAIAACPRAAIGETVREAYREGWMVNAIPPNEHEAGPEYVRGCEEVDWQQSKARAAFASPSSPPEDANAPRYGSNHFHFAAPGDHQADVWMLVFDDADRGNMLFGGEHWAEGEAERAAWKAWNLYAPTYNCRLFRLASLNRVSIADETLEDCRTHRRAWRAALGIALAGAEVRLPDIDDKSYWRHELAVFDRVFAALSSTPTPIDGEDSAPPECDARTCEDPSCPYTH